MSRAPHTEDGRPMIQPVTLDRGLWHWYHSAGDDLTNGRAEGPVFALTVTSQDPDAHVEWQYNDWVEMAGGVAFFKNAEVGDYVSFKLTFPATSGTSTPGTGNANKVSIGTGINMFVPAAGDGDWTIDLEDRDQVCPVLAEGQTGYWEWSWPDEGVGAVSPGIPGNSYYNLFDFPIDPATRFIPRVNLLGSGEARFLPENVHPTDLLPHWKVRCDLHHGGGDNTLQLVWHVVAARKVAR